MRPVDLGGLFPQQQDRQPVRGLADRPDDMEQPVVAFL